LRHGYRLRLSFVSKEACFTCRPAGRDETRRVSREMLC
jgi:hypothetical protein